MSLDYICVVYYDLKSPNILVFEFPPPEESTQVSMGYCKLPIEKFLFTSRSLIWVSVVN